MGSKATLADSSAIIRIRRMVSVKQVMISLEAATRARSYMPQAQLKCTRTNRCSNGNTFAPNVGARYNIIIRNGPKMVRNGNFDKLNGNTKVVIAYTSTRLKCRLV